MEVLEVEIEHLQALDALRIRGRKPDACRIGDAVLDAVRDSAREGRDALGITGTHGGEVDDAKEQERSSDRAAPSHEPLRTLRHESRRHPAAVLVAELDDHQDQPDGDRDDGHAGVGEVAESPAEERGAEADRAQEQADRLDARPDAFEPDEECDDRQQNESHPADHEALLDDHHPAGHVGLEEGHRRHHAVPDSVVGVDEPTDHCREDEVSQDRKKQEGDEQEEEDDRVADRLPHTRPALLLGLQAGREAVEQPVLPVLQPHFGVRGGVIHAVGREDPPNVQARRQGQERLVGLLEPFDLFPAQGGEPDHVFGVLAGAVRDHLPEGDRVVVESEGVGRQDVASLTLVTETQVLVDLELRERLDGLEVEPLVFAEVGESRVPPALAGSLGHDLDLDPSARQLLPEAVGTERIAIKARQDIEELAPIDNRVLLRRVKGSVVDVVGPLRTDVSLALVRVRVDQLALLLQLLLHLFHLGRCFAEHERDRLRESAEKRNRAELDHRIDVRLHVDIRRQEVEAHQARIGRDGMREARQGSHDGLLVQEVVQVEPPQDLLDLLLGHVLAGVDEKLSEDPAELVSVTTDIGHRAPLAG